MLMLLPPVYWLRACAATPAFAALSAALSAALTFTPARMAGLFLITASVGAAVLCGAAVGPSRHPEAHRPLLVITVALAAVVAITVTVHAVT